MSILDSSIDHKLRRAAASLHFQRCSRVSVGCRWQRVAEARVAQAPPATFVVGHSPPAAGHAAASIPFPHCTPQL